MSTRQEPPKDDDSDATFDRAKRPMIVAAIGVAFGLAIAGSVERTAISTSGGTLGGVIVIAAWAVGIFALHRLGRAGSSSRA